MTQVNHFNLKLNNIERVFFVVFFVNSCRHLPVKRLAIRRVRTQSKDEINEEKGPLNQQHSCVLVGGYFLTAQ